MKAITRMRRAGGPFLLGMLTAACASSNVAREPQQPFPIEEYARCRSETNTRLAEVSTSFMPRLQAGSVEEQRQAVKQAAAFVREHLGPHARQVDTLYTFADRQAGPRYTETMQYEHEQIESRIRFLELLADSPEPDVKMFRSQLNSLLGVMWWHIDIETNTIGVLVVENEMERRHQAGGQHATTAKGQ